MDFTGKWNWTTKRKLKGIMSNTIKEKAKAKMNKTRTQKALWMLSPF